MVLQSTQKMKQTLGLKEITQCVMQLQEIVIGNLGKEIYQDEMVIKRGIQWNLS